MVFSAGKAVRYSGVCSIPTLVTHSAAMGIFANLSQEVRVFPRRWLRLESHHISFSIWQELSDDSSAQPADHPWRAAIPSHSSISGIAVARKQFFTSREGFDPFHTPRGVNQSDGNFQFLFAKVESDCRRTTCRFRCRNLPSSFAVRLDGRGRSVHCSEKSDHHC